MSADLIIKKAAAEGVSVRLENDNKLKACGPAEARAKWLPVLREHKSELLAELTGGNIKAARPQLRQGGESWRSYDGGSVENSLEEKRNAVETIYAQMEAERERRRDWHVLPVEGWRDGRLTLRNIARDETVVVDLRKWRSGR
ncbi:hypothetical protein [Methylocystis sp.]|uniref:hypothetical protein n=1 Tax=Methylocystis sp. TaxID=1911079 RepID=UPI003DA2323A